MWPEETDLSRPTRHLPQGAIIADRRPQRVSTILGSCVSVCLFDPVAAIGGINHYLLPFWNGDGMPTPRFGNIAIERLHQKLLQLGAAQSRLQAKIFGGASLLTNGSGPFSVGTRNIDLARFLLEQLSIPIVVADVGGRTGRKIIFNTATGEVELHRHRATATGLTPSARPVPRRAANPVDTAPLLR